MSKQTRLPDGTVVTDCFSDSYGPAAVASTNAGSEKLSLGQSRVPDVLECLANLSSDEVFTPPRIANEMLDLLPPEVWTDPTLRWLDPGCKSGVFLREAARRLMDGLVEAFPDPDERRHHIFTEMLHGYAITELTAMISRRTLYYTKDAASDDLAVVPMPSPEGNVWFERLEHDFGSTNHCTICGAHKGTYDRGDGSLETHAYGFLHRGRADTDGVQFDVLIGNPPYQLGDPTGATSASPLYHLFVQNAIALKPRYVSFIIPSRWFNSGKGLGKFREQMLGDRHISHLVDYPNAADAFPDVEIKGGVCYFLWDRNHNGPCRVQTVEGGHASEGSERFLDKGDVLVRFNQGISIIDKVKAHGEVTLENQVSSQTPFGLHTNFDGFTEKKGKDSVRLYKRGGVAWVAKRKITKNSEWVPRHKVLISMAYNGGENFPHQIIGKPIVASPNTACTQTYLVAGMYDSAHEAENFAAFLRTRFARFMISMRKITQHAKPGSFAFVPKLDMTVRWTDQMLYQRYGLAQDEIDFIESRIKEMS